MVFPNSDLAKALGLDLRRETTLEECLRRPEIAQMWPKPGRNVVDLEFKALEQFEIETKYAGYIKRQDGEIEKYADTRGCVFLPNWTFYR